METETNIQYNYSMKDQQIFDLIRMERERQTKGIELIASENYVSDQVLQAMGSVLTNKYAEGYPAHRYYGGCEVVDQVEELARTRLKQLYGAAYVNVQPHSGAQANMAVFMACLKAGDTFMGLNLSHGGHLSHGSSVNFSGLMFNAIPLENIGLQWEPCHQMVQLIDPMPQLREWTKRFVHIHGKDATIHRDTLAKYGFYGTKPFAFHRTPGFGDSNWTEIISELRRNGFKGSIDIEGWHDPVYRGELEMTGQVNGLNYLKRCRGEFYPNPA